jgi:hypothetical protein
MDGWMDGWMGVKPGLKGIINSSSKIDLNLLIGLSNP